MKTNEKKAENENKYLIECLKDPMLFRRITEDGLDELIVGEDQSRKVVFLCAVGSLVKGSNIASYNLLVNSESGAGKDHLVKNVLSLFPQEIIIKRTRITPAVLNYWHNSKFEPNWTWNGRVLYLEDCSNAVFNSDVFKVMSSSGSKVTITINQTAVDIEIKGKPVIIVTSASANPNPELLRRFIIVNLDESKEQTKEIMLKSADQGTLGKIKFEPNDYIKAMEFLGSYYVKIPFAKEIIKHFPSDHLIMRTHFQRFLDLIKASAVLHQFQREKDVDDHLIADAKDYDVARLVLLKITSNQQMLPLTKNQQEILNIIDKLPKDKIIKSESGFETEVKAWYSISDIEPLISFISDRQLRTELRKLTNLGFLKQDKEKREVSNKSVMVYSCVQTCNINIPLWKDIQNTSSVSTTSTTSITSNVSNTGTIETIETNVIEIKDQK